MWTEIIYEIDLLNIQMNEFASMGSMNSVTLSVVSVIGKDNYTKLKVVIPTFNYIHKTAQ